MSQKCRCKSSLLLLDQVSEVKTSQGHAALNVSKATLLFWINGEGSKAVCLLFLKALIINIAAMLHTFLVESSRTD